VAEGAVHLQLIVAGQVRRGGRRRAHTERPRRDRSPFYHTVVLDEFGGRGLAGTLTRTALSTSIQAGRRIVAVCPYVKKWLTTHHDFDDATDPVGREHLRALR
jgi:predicted GNAT family acetyltransferase